MKSSLDISVVIPVFNQLHYTSRCVEDLNRAGVADQQIVIINNASTDGTAEFLSRRPDIHVFSNSQNRGCAGAWNQGAKSSTAAWTVVSNNDVLFAPGTFSELIQFAEDNRVDIASPAMCEGEADYDFQPYALDFIRAMSAVTRWNVASGSCFMVHRRVFEQVGFFDDDPKLGGYEDDEFFRRARRAGLRLAITGRAYYHHFGGTTQKSIKVSMSQPKASLGDRTYYRKKTGQTWAKRKATQIQVTLRGFWWKNSEKLRHGHTLHETRLNGECHFR